MSTLKALTPKAHTEIERKLMGRLRNAQAALRGHEAQTCRCLPKDAEEAAPIKSEMDVTESEERAEADQIKLIQDALERLKDGTYGMCVSCRSHIPKERLRVVPESPFCLVCQKSFETESRGEDWPY